MTTGNIFPPPNFSEPPSFSSFFSSVVLVACLIPLRTQACWSLNASLDHDHLVFLLLLLYQLYYDLWNCQIAQFKGLNYSRYLLNFDKGIPRIRLLIILFKFIDILNNILLKLNIFVKIRGGSNSTKGYISEILN